MASVTGIDLSPAVVPDVLAKYRGLPGQQTSASPASCRSIQGRKSV